MNILMKIPPPVHGLLLLSLCKGLDMLLPLSMGIYSPSLSMVIAMSGLGIVIWGLAQFILIKTTPIPLGKPRDLVTIGPYRYTRNPMYLGLLLMVGSVTFFTGSLVYLLSPLGLFLIIDRLFIPYEEATLDRLFGIRFEAFKREVKRWL